MKRTRLLWVLLVVLAAGSAGWAYYRYGRPEAATAGMPTAVARQGEFLVIVSSRGELVADRSVLVTAPLNVPNLQLVWTAPPGGAVKQGEVILRFDASGAKRQLEEKEAALKQAQASLEQATSHTKITEEQDKLELASLAHVAKRAELEVSKQEIVSKVQADLSKVDLGLAESKLKVQAATLALNKASGQSKIASLQAAVDKAQAEVNITRRRIERMEVKAPSNGILSFLMNYSQGWMNAKPFKAGDNVWPGSSIAEIPDLNSLQFKGKLEEIERGRVTPGQAVRMHLDPFPERPFDGKVASISPLTEQNFEWPPSKNFRAYGTFANIDPRLRPGMNGRMDMVVDRIPNAISVPAKAVFAREGKPFVLAISPAGPKPTAVEIVARNPDEVAIRGIDAGTRVALVDSANEQKKASKK